MTSTSGSAPSSRDPLCHLRAHDLERGTAEEGRRELDVDAVVLDRDVADDTEIDDRDHGDLRVLDLAEGLPDGLRRYHSAPGTERRTSVISSQSGGHSSECVPRSSPPRSGGSSRPSVRPGVDAVLRQTATAAGQARQRRLEARLVPQPLLPHLRMDAVVRLLTVHLGGEPGDLLVVGRLQRLEPDLVGRLVQDVPRDRPRPVHLPQLDERRRAVLLRRAVERELVRGRPQPARRDLVQRPRVPDLVLRDGREGDVLLEERRDSRPFRVAPAEDQLVVRVLKKFCASPLGRPKRLPPASRLRRRRVHAPPSA